MVNRQWQGLLAKMASIEEWSHVERWINDCFLRFNERKGEDGMMDAFPFDLRSRSAYHLPAGTMRDLTAWPTSCLQSVFISA